MWIMMYIIVHIEALVKARNTISFSSSPLHAHIILLGCSTHRVQTIAVYPPRRYVGGHEADELRVEVGDYLLTSFCYRLGATSYFDASHLAWLGRIVNHEGCAPGARGIAVLLTRAHAMTAYVYGVKFGVVAEAGWDDMRLACCVYGGDSSKALVYQIFDFSRGEDAHGLLFPTNSRAIITRWMWLVPS